ncbi:hypothetical protein D3C73_634540 [compost metagenome]
MRFNGFKIFTYRIHRLSKEDCQTFVHIYILEYAFIGMTNWKKGEGTITSFDRKGIFTTQRICQ